MFFTSKKLLSSIRGILGFAGGGVHKRIDENRELWELLRDEAPELLAAKPWIVGWLRGNDEFFQALASTVPITKGLYLSAAKLNPERFPRPWPYDSENEKVRQWNSDAR